MRKSLSLRMFPDAMPIRRRVELAAAAGFHGVEVNLEPWQEVSLASSDDDLPRPPPDDRGAWPVRKHRLQPGAMAYSHVQPRSWQCAPVAGDVVAALARAATILGAGSVLVMPGAIDNSILAPEPEIVPYDVAYRNASEMLRELGRTAGEQLPGPLGGRELPRQVPGQPPGVRPLPR